jgi:NADH-quinone oxidoreductase subunit F
MSADLKLKDRNALVLSREIYKKSLSAEKRKVFVCAGTGCIASGSLEIYDKLAALVKEKNIPCSVELKEEPEHPAGLKKSGCHGLCDQGPLILIEPEGWLYTRVKPEDAGEIARETIAGGRLIERLLLRKDGKTYGRRDVIPFYQKQTRIVLENCGKIHAESIKEYLAVGGYSAFEKALFEMSREEIIAEISESNLRGRGGGGFPAGVKWNQVYRQKNTPKYVVCNGDEGDPGAFMDQSVMEGLPHQMIEGMLIAGLAAGAEEGYIYVRAEYPQAVKRLGIAIAQAGEAGLLGENILGSGFNFSLRIFRGAGAFVCGEGSALTASIEGKRGMPRVKRYRTVEQGLYEKPTLLNNVETFANVPLIISRGAAWYKSIGPANSPGTKTFALTGDIVNTGLIEVPMGTPLGEVIYDIGGGMRDGTEFKAVQAGGPSGGCLTKKDMDLPLDFDSLKQAGAIIGSGGLVVMNTKTCMVEIARFFMDFTQNESCGKCIPCREGTKRMLEILERIVAGLGKEGDIELLEELADTIANTALCGLGKTAPFPVISTIKNFRAEYEAHIREKRCPAESCQKIKTISIDAVLCKGCTKCAKGCPTEAIKGETKKVHVIDQAKCIKCGACVSVCPFHAVKEAS